ncbi:MAG: CBS domain-containing protein [bacterium]
MKSKTVQDYMTQNRYLITFQPDTDIFFAIEMLINRSISGAPVVNKAGELVGVLSEKDCLKVMLQMTMHHHPAGTVGEYMSNEVKTLDQNKTILDAVEAFQKSVFRRFPVTDGKKLVGLITRRDILRAIKETI